MGLSKGLLQAYQMQDLAFNMAMALKEEAVGEDGKMTIRRDLDGKPIDAPVIASLVKSWQTAQERISFHRRVPSPGVLKPDERKKKRRHPNQDVGGPITLAPEPIPLPDVDVSAS